MNKLIPSFTDSSTASSAMDRLSVMPGFYPRGESEELYQRLRQQQPWPDNHYEVAGRRFRLPRLQTWHADTGIVYSYSNNLLQTRPWTALLLSIRQRVEQRVGHRFNAVLVNFYRNGEDYVGWHSDDEREMGAAPVIASLSLGQARVFEVRPLGDGACRSAAADNVQSLWLHSGDLIVMEAGFQQHWEHRVPTQDAVTGGRINLTFRYVLPP